MGPTSIPQLESLIGRLPITEENYGTFVALLALPYDLFRPIMDMLLAGVAFPEDLTDAQQNQLAGALKLADGNLARAALAAADPAVNTAALVATLEAAFAGRRASAVVLPRDQTAVGLGPDGGILPAYAPASQEVYSYDSDLTYPNAIEVLRAGSLAAARKAASAAFAAAMNPKVF
jgi:hypothetical protein